MRAAWALRRECDVAARIQEDQVAMCFVRTMRARADAAAFALMCAIRAIEAAALSADILVKPTHILKCNSRELLARLRAMPDVSAQLRRRHLCIERLASRQKVDRQRASPTCESMACRWRPSAAVCCHPLIACRREPVCTRARARLHRRSMHMALAQLLHMRDISWRRSSLIRIDDTDRARQ